MSRKTFYTLFIIAQTIFTAGMVLWYIGTFGHNHPTVTHVGTIIMCFGSLCILLLVLLQKKLDKDNSDKTNS